ncbi:hypothetical protein ZIOFF_025736 [Zingiber officinale]|uniref:Legume lectin domain-containing protein n=1 Tax=Zingiber officinale TaxID=94328 RepID=A0A8J5H315_ZINOF|nr:hypothetical protein ZIOFF_025736 [Zingiber officinale]
MCRSRILISTFVVCFLAGFPSSSSLSFNFGSFPNDVFVSDILLQGDADNGNGGIELTKDTLIGTVAESGGRASYQKDIFLLWDAQTMQLSDFTTRFVFDIRPQAQTNFTGDGLAFFLSVPVPTYSPTLSMPTYSFTSDAQVNSINGSGCEATGRICSETNGMLDGCGVIGEKWNARWSWGYGTLIPDPEALPSMEQAISVLNFEAPLPELPPAIFEYSNEF